MKKTLLFAALALTAVTAKTEMIAAWNFNALSIATASAPGAGGVPTTIASDYGTGSLSLLSWTGLVDDFGGSALNAQNSDPAEESLSLVSNAGNGSYIEFSFNMTGYKDMDVSFATRGTSTGYNSGVWSYSTNGSDFTNFGANTGTTSTTFAIVNSGITTGLDNSPTAFLRYTLSGATSTTGNNRIDNLVISATAIPEPGMVALLLVGFGVVFRFIRRK